MLRSGAEKPAPFAKKNAGMLVLKASIAYSNNIGMQEMENHNQALILKFRTDLMQVLGVNGAGQGQSIEQYRYHSEPKVSFAALQAYLKSN